MRKHSLFVSTNFVKLTLSKKNYHYYLNFLLDSLHPQIKEFNKILKAKEWLPRINNDRHYESPSPLNLTHQINISSFPFYGFTKEKESIPNDTEKL